MHTHAWKCGNGLKFNYSNYFAEGYAVKPAVLVVGGERGGAENTEETQAKNRGNVHTLKQRV